MRSFRPLGVAFILLAGASRPAGSQTAFRVKDIRPGTESSYPTGMAEVAGTVFFAAFWRRVEKSVNAQEFFAATSER